jgi:hypothetical protein
MRIGAVIADTYPDKRIARFAVERTLREFPVDECLLLSDNCFVNGARHVSIGPLSSISSYNELILDRLPAWTDCDAYLLVQWDGFVLDGRRWRAEFLDCDYIGAPWAHMGGVVGAGGFSLRSQSLIETLHRLRQQEPAPDIDTAEDLQICFKYRAALQASELRIAGAETAAAFAFERPLAVPDRMPVAVPNSFGFHGVFNFPLVLPEDEILVLFDSMLPRIGRSWAVWYLFVWHAWQRRYKDVGIRALAALGERDANLWGQVAQACLRQGMSPGWLKGTY